MKLLFIRHGDPDYTIDSLTEKGWKEAEFLSEKIAALDVRDFYVSPLGRAKDTASCTLKKNGRTATECKWLREFDVKIRRPDLHGEKIIPWDWLPQDWTKIENFYSFDRWWDNDILREGKMKEEYDWVTQNFDKAFYTAYICEDTVLSKRIFDLFHVFHIKFYRCTEKKIITVI